MFNVDDKYDLPRDVVHKDSLIEIIGRNEFVVENYRCLKEIKDNEIYLSNVEILEENGTLVEKPIFNKRRKVKHKILQ